MKIIICEFNQETNSFSPVTKIEDYERGGIFEGEKMRMELSGRPCAVAGMLKAAKDANAEAVTAYSMYSQSGGPVEQSVVDIFLEKTMEIIRKNMPVDGVFISFHGATQSTQYDDVCGLISEVIRKEVGTAMVIAASCDLHANITDKMLENCNVICGYHTYPHTDFFETGYRAAKLGFECITGEKKLHMARVKIPMMVPASTYTTFSGPFAELMSYGRSLVKAGKLLDFSIFQMQPWLDVEKAGSVVLAISKELKVSEDYAV
ncbi:MAG: M81 family metallopeptidase, partial [Pseudomonadota bacterium]